MTRTPSTLADLLADCDAHGIRLALADLDRLEGNLLFPPDVMEGLRAAEMRWIDESPDCDLATEPITDPIGPDGWPVDCIDPDELTPCPKCGTLECGNRWLATCSA